MDRGQELLLLCGTSDVYSMLVVFPERDNTEAVAPNDGLHFIVP